MMRRARVIAWLLAGLLPLAAAQSAGKAKLPQRNLMVELRQAQDEHRDTPAVAGGSVTIRSDGSIQGRTPGSVTTRSRDAARESIQQLLVLNGGRGAMRLSQSVPYQFVQIRLTPRGIEALPGTVWRDTGTGFVVQPSWPGGMQPVTVALTAEAGETSLLTTLQLPLDEWVTIARGAGASAGGGDGLVLQMRVSAP